jgi:arylsulfatase A-like enzyme
MHVDTGVPMRALFLALLCLLPTLPALAQSESPPDIIVVLLDDMRADEWQALPQTQALLEDGTWYENFILTTPLCCPSRASLLTGTYAHNHGVETNRGGYEAFRDAGNEERTLAVLLDGYDAALIGKYLNSYDEGDPMPPGWDVWEPYRGEPSYDWRGGYATDVQRDLAVAFVGDGDLDPKFLWFAPYAPHDPATYATRHTDAFPDAAETERNRLRTILAVDEAIVAIHTALGPERAEGALWFVLSDNGFLFGEHGIDNGKNVPYDIAVRVPMLARGPGLTSGTDERITANIDLAPLLVCRSPWRWTDVPCRMPGSAMAS